MQKHSDSKETKLTGFPRDQLLSNLLYHSTTKTLENTPENKSSANNAILRSDVIDLALSPFRDFWREIVSLLDVV